MAVFFTNCPILCTNCIVCNWLAFQEERSSDPGVLPAAQLRSFRRNANLYGQLTLNILKKSTLFTNKLRFYEFQFVNLLADFGGTLGLWLGQFLTLFIALIILTTTIIKGPTDSFV